MSKNILKAMTSIVFTLACLFVLSKSAWAGTMYQTGNSETSVTVNWESLASYNSGSYSMTAQKIGYVEIPQDADYEKESSLKAQAETNAQNGQITVTPGTYSYTITGLKAQAEYYVVLYYAYTSSYGYAYENTAGIPAFTKIKKVTNVAQRKWWKYIESVDVSWDTIPSYYSSNVSYDIVFMDAKGNTIEKKTGVSYNSYSHAIKNNKIYKIKVRATRKADSYNMKGMGTETTAWSDVQYLFTQPTITSSSLTKSKMKLKWGKIAGVTSYDVYVSTKQNSGFKKVKTLKAKKTSVTIKKFKGKKLKKLKKKKYYVYIVPNKKVNGKIVKKDVTYVYEIRFGKNGFSEGYK